MNAESKKTVLRMIPYGLYVLTADDGKGNISAATVNWVTQSAFAPPLVVVGVKTDSHAHPAIKESGAFALNILGKDQGPMAFTFFKPAQRDGNTVSGDGCRADYTTEECGDGIQDAGEQCDDGNANLGDGCRPDCTSEICGDGIQDPQEQCDDGNTTSGDGCNALCESEGVTCSPASGGRTVRVDIATPVSLAGIRVDLEYPQAHTSIPGFGNSSLVQSRVTILQTGGQSVMNDRDTDLTVVLANATAFLTSGPLYEVDFDQCTARDENMCNRNQNVIGCCNDTNDPNQFGDFCANLECSNLPGTVCTVATEVAVCGGAGLCVKRPCVSDASCAPTLGTCVGKCPANPPVCPVGTFPTGGMVGPCTTVNGGCPGDNACVTQTASTICTVTDPVDDMGNPVDGVTCSVTITEVP